MDFSRTRRHAQLTGKIVHITDHGPEVIKLFFMLNPVEYEILNAQKYKNIKKFGFFPAHTC